VTGSDTQEVRQNLIAFLQTIARPGFDMGQVNDAANLLDAGALDSLAFVLVVEYLESTYGISFSSATIDPTRLTSVEQILAVIVAAGK
jgi:acyl carrier protein